MLAGRIADARKLYSIQDVLGLPSNLKKIVCPLPQHSHSSHPTPSFSIYISKGIQKWECHGNCGLRGDVVDLVGYMDVPGYEPHDPAKVSLALALLGNRPIEFDRPRREVPVILSSLAWRSYLPLGREAEIYTSGRGLAPETASKFKLGHYKHYLSIPAFEEKVLKAIKFRNMVPPFDAENYNRYFSARGSVSALFNYDAVVYTGLPVLIVKGEIACMVCDQFGFLACAPTTGEAGSMEQWVPVLSFSEKRVVVGDNDFVPEIRKNMQDKAKARAKTLHADLRFPPEQYKDIDNWLLAEPFVAVQTIMEWMK